ncbi:MAG: MBL fold metallo-hydrolase [Thermoplasmatota archaeon]
MVFEITAEELRDIQDSRKPYTLIDIRRSDDFKEWHIKGAVSFDISNIDTLSTITYNDINQRLGLGKEDQIIIICAKGVTSKEFAIYLEDIGFNDVKVVKGGMEAWSGVYDIVNMGTKDDDLVIIQLQRRAKGCIGYIIGSKSSGKAVAIDVSRYIKEFKDIAGKEGLTIERVFDTHIHADHISGGRKLSQQLDIPYHLGSKAENREVEVEYTPLKSNEVITIGDVKIKTIHTPGHTSEMTSFMINDEFLMTGDTLFVESIGRTELEFTESKAKKGAELQYESIHKSLLSKPDEMKILPSHFTVTSEGDFVEVIPGKPIFTTVGYLRENNEILQLEKDNFIDYMLDNLPEKPPNYSEIIAVNLGKKSFDEDKATEMELGPNRCAASKSSMIG